jgi:hypothetical protein
MEIIAWINNTKNRSLIAMRFDMRYGRGYLSMLIFKQYIAINVLIILYCTIRIMSDNIVVVLATTFISFVVAFSIPFIIQNLKQKDKKTLQQMGK